MEANLGGRLIALSKKNNGVRPLACGGVVRRIVAKAKNDGAVKGVLFVMDSSGVENKSVPESSVIEKRFEECLALKFGSCSVSHSVTEERGSKRAR